MTRTELLRLIGTLGWVFAISMLSTDRRLIRRLRSAGALSPETAAPLEVGSPMAKWRLARLRNGGAVVEAEPGRFFLDSQGYSAYRRTRRRRAFAAIAVVLTMFLVVTWLGVL